MRELYDRPGGRKDRDGHRYTGLLALTAASLLASPWPVDAASDQSVSAAAPPALKLASWNLDWLIAPLQFKALRERCTTQNDPRARSERAIPCDVAYHLERSGSDFAALANYAHLLNADVIALQEVDGEPAARLVFPGYEFCFTARRHPQNNGFAVRRGIAHRCEPDFLELSAHDSLRRGAVMTLYPGEPRAITLMSVHLKSGCSLAPLDSPAAACRGLAGQLAPLTRWLEAEHARGRRFGVIGDFNRDLDGEQPGHSRGRAGDESVRGSMTAALRASPAFGAQLADAGHGSHFQNCFPGQMHRGYIDHILLGPGLARAEIPGSFEHLTYRVLDAHRRKLSDHCPVAIRLRVDGLAFD